MQIDFQSTRPVSDLQGGVPFSVIANVQSAHGRVLSVYSATPN